MIKSLVAAQVQLLLDLRGWHHPGGIVDLAGGISPVDALDVVPFDVADHAGPLCSQR